MNQTDKIDFILAVLTPIALVMILALAWARRRRVDVDREALRLSRVEAKLDLLSKHAGLDFAPHASLPPLPDDVADAQQRGKKISAIKLYRGHTKVGLAEAKAIVEEAERKIWRLAPRSRHVSRTSPAPGRPLPRPTSLLRRVPFVRPPPGTSPVTTVTVPAAPALSPKPLSGNGRGTSVCH